MGKLLKATNNIVFFDGVCTLCNKSVSSLVAIDAGKNLKYSSIQGKLANELFNDMNYTSMDSILFWKDGILYQKSEAVAEILLKLGGAYKFAGAFLKLFPYSFLDLFYNFIARNRYSVFGKDEVCRIPNDNEKSLFID